ncbi:MAG: uncharacterized protein H6R10_3326 [Rhodocyclaceae bacterium]|nr:uncharacterized protein [Rhodocyclaceae bacterium]
MPVIAGALPRRAAKLVREWCQEHQADLAADWELAQRYEPLNMIPGADND